MSMPKIIEKTARMTINGIIAVRSDDMSAIELLSWERIRVERELPKLRAKLATLRGDGVSTRGLVDSSERVAHGTRLVDGRRDARLVRRTRDRELARRAILEVRRSWPSRRRHVSEARR